MTIAIQSHKHLSKQQQEQQPFSNQQPSTQWQASPIQHTRITLPRGMLDLRYQTSGSYQLDDLLGFAQRINPKRAFLFVSKVLGRHIPVAPRVMRQAFRQLTDNIPNGLPEPIVVVGMAETAVGLSAGVHQELQSRYPDALLLNSTRHAQHDASLFTTFSEDHSHASTHLIYQSDDPKVQRRINNSKTLVMVDDEASTGNTCVNVVSALRDAGLDKLEKVHLATLVDWSLGSQTEHSDSGSKKHESRDDKGIGNRLDGVSFERHHLMAGSWSWQDTPNPDPINMPSVDTTEAGSQPILMSGNWGRLPTSDSTDGFTQLLAQFKLAYDNATFTSKTWADDLESESLPARILVLGSNEFVWLPFLLAEWLENQINSASDLNKNLNKKSDKTVKFSALTRSPIAIGGAIESVLSFKDNYGLGMTNFVYNVNPDDWDLMVLCIETSADSVDELWQTLDNVIVVSPA